MTRLALEHKKLSPNTSIVKVKDTKNNLITWRYRYSIRTRGLLLQKIKDYSLDKFKDFKIFEKYIIKLPKKDQQVL